MIESALGQLIGSILAGGGTAAAHTSKKLNDTLPKEEEPEIKSKKEETPKAEERELTKQEKADLEYLLVAGGLSTKEAKQALSGDLIPRKMLKGMDRDVLKQIADITGKNGYEDFIYDGDKLGKGYTSIPLTKANKPKGETMPVPEKKKGSNTTTTKGEEAKDKKTVMKGEGTKSKGTVMEIPEKDFSKLIEMVGYSDYDENDPKISALLDQLAMKHKTHRKVVANEFRKYWNAKHQKQLEDDLQKQAQKDGRVSYDKKINDPKFKKATEEAGEKYKKETPDYKYDDVKRKNEAKGEEYTTERHTRENPAEIEKADDFVKKNAGRDYDARLDRAKNYTSIYRPGK